MIQTLSGHKEGVVHLLCNNLGPQTPIFQWVPKTERIFIFSFLALQKAFSSVKIKSKGKGQGGAIMAKCAIQKGAH